MSPPDLPTTALLLARFLPVLCRESEVSIVPAPTIARSSLLLPDIKPDSTRHVCPLCTLRILVKVLGHKFVPEVLRAKVHPQTYIRTALEGHRAQHHRISSSTASL
ncbi:hypothetical protein C8Q74DRAFT_1257979 [Fomes fomentarius]|nr:hypothetical protein C8Q74DRAFT_1257979 [Fomes fomentarius]